MWAETHVQVEALEAWVLAVVGMMHARFHPSGEEASQIVEIFVAE
jgi:hypothetical protein